MRHLKLFFIAIAFSLCLGGCNYLDRAPDAGLDEKEVFSKLANFQKYFYGVYNGANYSIRCHYPLHFCMNTQKITLEEFTDICDKTRIQRAQAIKQGDGAQATPFIGYETADSNYPNNAKVPNSWKCIRVCNMAISKIDMLQDATEQQINDLLGQAYFVRAFCHFELFRLYGSLPYVDKVLGPDDEWDVPCVEDYEFLQRCAQDYYTAYEYLSKAGVMRRDATGNLESPDMDKPNGVTALAMRSRVLLYAASPLNNPAGDIKRWEDAADAASLALNAALENKFSLLSMADYSKNFYGVKYSKEQLWGWTSGSTYKYNAARIDSFIGYTFNDNKFSAAQCPTQNFVDKFETLGGYALNTEADREIATQAGEYNEQNPFVNRDPRFDNCVLYNGKTFPGYGQASLYLLPDGSKPDDSLMRLPADVFDGVTETFYYEKKRIGPLSIKGQQNIMLTDPIIRLAEVYLNYAEAANEAWGPEGKSIDAELNATEAVNVIRERAQMPPVRAEYLVSKESLRERIKNERTVELCFEGFHYFCDIRRWKDAPALYRSTLYGMRATKLDAPTAEYPTGFKYERFPLPASRQIAWKNDGMYWFRFRDSDLLKMKNYQPKENW